MKLSPDTITSTLNTLSMTLNARHESYARKARRCILALGLVLWTEAAVSEAQSWATIEQNAAPALGQAITSDIAGNLFTAGSVKDASGRDHAVIRKSVDGGATWVVSLDLPSVNDPSAPNGSLATFNAITSIQLPSGESQVVATGRIKRVYNAAGVLSGQWLTVRSRDGGISWEAIDEYTHESYNQISGVTAPRGVALDESGNIYVVGSGEETLVSGGKKPTTTTIAHWLIRKGVANADGTLTWSIVGNIPFTVTSDAEKANSYPSCVACVGNNVFVGGGGRSTLQVWKSSDAGANWQLILSTYYLNNVDQWHAFGIAGDSLGRAYVVGQGFGITRQTGVGKNATSLTDKFWFVMKESDDGSHFSDVGPYYRYPVTNGTAGAYAVTVAPNDDVFVTGYGASPTTPTRWVTRQYSAANSSWTTIDDFSLSPTGYAEGRGITTDSFGNVFATGVATNPPSTQYGWFVRRNVTP